MASLTIPDIEAELERRLRLSAARNGHSVEEEARRGIAGGAGSAWDFIRRLREKAGGGPDFEPLHRSERIDRPVDFGSFSIRMSSPKPCAESLIRP